MKKLREGRYTVLSGDSYESVNPPVPPAQEAPASSKPTSGKLRFINKLFKVKSKNSGDQATISSVYEQSKIDSPNGSIDAIKEEPKGLINRRKRQVLAYYNKKFRQSKKHSEAAKMNSDAENKEQEKVTQKEGEQAGSSLNNSPAEPDPKPIVTLHKGSDLSFGDHKALSKKQAKKKKQHNTGDEIDDNKVEYEKVLILENVPSIKVPELKVATMESIKENELPVEEEPAAEDVAGIQESATANVSFEGAGAVFNDPIVHKEVKEVMGEPDMNVYFSEATRLAFNLGLPHDQPSTSSYQPNAVFAMPRTEDRPDERNVWPTLFGGGSSSSSSSSSVDTPANNSGIYKLKDATEEQLNTLQNLLQGTNVMEQIKFHMEQEAKATAKAAAKATAEATTKATAEAAAKATAEAAAKATGKAAAKATGKARRSEIAAFFAEEARHVANLDYGACMVNIEIARIETSSDDVRSYRRSLRFKTRDPHREMMVRSVEIALDFIEKITANREKKNMEMKKKESKKAKEAKKTEFLCPKVWLVFNRHTKEKVVICTPAEFCDSD